MRLALDLHSVDLPQRDRGRDRERDREERVLGCERWDDCINAYAHNTDINIVSLKKKEGGGGNETGIGVRVEW